MAKIQNYLDKLVAHYASIFRGSNIHIYGGIGVNEKIAVPKGSFPIKIDTSYWYWKESDVEELHPDGSLDVAVYQIASERPVLSYELHEYVPNSILRKLKKRNVGWGLGIIKTKDGFRGSYINKFRKLDEMQRFDFQDWFGNEESVLKYLWRIGYNAHIPYLLVPPNIERDYAVQHFLLEYNKANNL